jgi:hypothetical protein
VLGTFVGATQAFNDNDWKEYEKYLDQNVVAYNLGAAGYTIGKGPVTQYFSDISTGNNLDLQFDPTPEITWFPSLFPLSVRGFARWTHTAAGHIGVRIKYEFQFYPGSFLLTSVWANLI